MAFDQVANPVPSYTRKQAHRVAHTEGPTGKYLQWERILYSHTHTTLMRRLPSRLESSRLCSLPLLSLIAVSLVIIRLIVDRERKTSSHRMTSIRSMSCIIKTKLDVGLQCFV